MQHRGKVFTPLQSGGRGKDFCCRRFSVLA